MKDSTALATTRITLSYASHHVGALRELMRGVVSIRLIPPGDSLGAVNWPANTVTKGKGHAQSSGAHTRPHHTTTRTSHVCSCKTATANASRAARVVVQGEHRSLTQRAVGATVAVETRARQWRAGLTHTVTRASVCTATGTAPPHHGDTRLTHQPHTQR